MNLPATARSVIACCMLLQGGAACAQSSGTQMGPIVPGMATVPAQVRSMQDMRFANMVRQQYDYTCGAAALATILQQTFGRRIGEQEIIRDMLAHTDPEIVRSRGFSMLDMKGYVERIGLRGRGYQIDAKTLPDVSIPVIALQTTRGYAHFVVVKRIRHGVVYLADPALGHRQLSIDEFVAGWNGIVFAVLGDGRRKDNPLVDSSVPLAAAQREGVVTRSLPPQQEFGLFGIDTF